MSSPANTVVRTHQKQRFTSTTSGPSAMAGENDTDNLITACVDCNHGKGRRSLASTPMSLADRAKEINERERQINGYEEVAQLRRSRLESDAQAINLVFEKFCPGYTLNDRSLVSVKRFVDSLGFDAVLGAMEIACNSNGARTAQNVFKYFCGVCWRKIKGTE